MKTKFLAYPFLAATAIGVLGISGVASAQGFGFFGSTATPEQIAAHQQTMFQNEATLLGISIDDVKNGWAQGKSMLQIAADHGITKDQLKQKIKDGRMQQIKVQLQALVEKGIITQAQADQRLTFIQNNAGKGKGMMGLKLGRAMHK